MSEDGEVQATDGALGGITRKELQDALPLRLRNRVSPGILERVHSLLDEPEIWPDYRDNLLNLGTVLGEGRYKIEDYVCAVQFVSWRLGGLSVYDAYGRVFPDRVERWEKERITEERRRSYVSMYYRGKLVVRLMEQVMVPSWILNQDHYQEAVNVQVGLMRNSASDKVRCDAASALLTHLKPPEVSKVEIGVSEGTKGVIQEVRRAAEELMSNQREAIRSGRMTAREIAEMPLQIESGRGAGDND